MGPADACSVPREDSSKDPSSARAWREALGHRCPGSSKQGPRTEPALSIVYSRLLETGVGNRRNVNRTSKYPGPIKGARLSAHSLQDHGWSIMEEWPSAWNQGTVSNPPLLLACPVTLNKFSIFLCLQFLTCEAVVCYLLYLQSEDWELEKNKLSSWSTSTYCSNERWCEKQYICLRNDA